MASSILQHMFVVIGVTIGFIAWTSNASGSDSLLADCEVIGNRSFVAGRSDLVEVLAVDKAQAAADSALREGLAKLILGVDNGMPLVSQVVHDVLVVSHFLDDNAEAVFYSICKIPETKALAFDIPKNIEQRDEPTSASFVQRISFLPRTQNPRDTRDAALVHGMVTFVIWGINLSIGAAVARYYRDNAHWFQIHKGLQTINTLLTIPLIGLAATFSSDCDINTCDPYTRVIHRYLGRTIVILSFVQAGTGNFSHFLHQVSKYLFLKVQSTENMSHELSEWINEMLVEDDMHKTRLGKKFNFFENFHERKKKLSKEAEKELAEFLSTCLHAYCNLSTSGNGWILVNPLTFTLKHTNQYGFRLYHRVLGRTLILMAYAQIYLGLDILDTGNDTILVLIYTWTALVLTGVLFKEIEYLLGLPKGLFPKLACILRCCTGSKKGDSDSDNSANSSFRSKASTSSDPEETTPLLETEGNDVESQQVQLDSDDTVEKRDQIQLDSGDTVEKRDLLLKRDNDSERVDGIRKMSKSDRQLLKKIQEAEAANDHSEVIRLVTNMSPDLRVSMDEETRERLRDILY